MKQTAPLEIGLPVIDLELMLAFYISVFGCEEVRRADIPAQLSEKIRVARNGYENVWLKFPGGEVVKLVRPTEPPQPRVVPEYTAEQTGIAYFTLYCADIAAAIAAAERHGGRLLSDRVLANSAAGVRLAFLADPEGNVFEFVQLPDAAPNAVKES